MNRRPTVDMKAMAEAANEQICSSASKMDINTTLWLFQTIAQNKARTPCIPVLEDTVRLLKIVS